MQSELIPGCGAEEHFDDWMGHVEEKAVREQVSVLRREGEVWTTSVEGQHGAACGVAWG